VDRDRRLRRQYDPDWRGETGQSGGGEERAAPAKLRGFYMFPMRSRTRTPRASAITLSVRNVMLCFPVSSR
jgi:hypothetical protein